MTRYDDEQDNYQNEDKQDTTIRETTFYFLATSRVSWSATSACMSLLFYVRVIIEAMYQCAQW